MTTLQASAQNQLRQLVESIERLEEERQATCADIRDKFAEAKSVGFDPKIMRKLLAKRRQSQTERDEEEALLATYMHALGMAGTPLGDWASQRDEQDETTISINDGPAHPMSVVKEAVAIVKKARSREATA